FILGGVAAFCFNELSTPLYKSEISLFTWNSSIADAIKKIKKNQKDKKGNKVQEIMTYNSIISQSLYLGQRLISDYITIINNPQVRKKTNEYLIEQGFKAPLEYYFECSIKRKSCIMDIFVVSPDRKLATAAANNLIKAFKSEQERLMNVKYAQAMHPATLPNSSFSPHKEINLLIGVLAGVLLGIGIAFILDYLDMTIKNPDDLKKINLLTLGCVPYYADIDSLYSCDKQKKNRQGNSILDTVRVINTTISFFKVDDPPKVIEFTSAMPGAGKSTQVLLLAKIAGAENKRVLIIDCDLRKPQIYKNLELSNPEGLVNYLTDSQCNEPEKYIHSDLYPNVDLMMHGIIPPNPTELLASKRFADMIDKLKNKYDCILLDSPPCSGMADAMVLGKVTDAIVLLVDAGATRAHDVVRNLEQLDSLRDKVIGVILNKVNFKKSRGYYYSYGYYYYGSEKPDSESPTMASDEKPV
ncbi:MAG: polysaccharide biosynthesis tyrosine autokinase, partial [Victivallaceae bacterium]|nr:polysaccharide biosynthesis tyrosine autokinase [Victivallaceae bacterium]